MLMLRDHGRMTLRDVLRPAIFYAEKGHPVLPSVSATIAGLSEFFTTEWPTSADTWLPNGQAPAAGALFRNPDRAATLHRLLREAEAINTYLKTACVADSTGARRRGVLTGQDMAGFQDAYERPRQTDYRSWTVWKTDFWSQDPSLLQSLNILEGIVLDGGDSN